MAVNLSATTESQLAEFIGQFWDNPYGFVMAAFPWEQPLLPDGTDNPLRHKTGPEKWQREFLEDLGEHIKKNGMLVDMGLSETVWKSAVASGHGVGKSALVAWLILFFMSTRPDTRGVVTASTQFQLEDKTWPELAKWYSLLINKHWFEWTSTGLTFKAYPEEKRKNYKTTAATVSEHKTEAFAGLHNEGKTVFIIFDEASGVLSKVWEVAEGALLGNGEKFFFAFGNPTQPDGEFADCFDKHAPLYHLKHVDSREVSQTNQEAVKALISKYGEDSDEIKVRVKGEFPVQSYNGFMATYAVTEAMQRELVFDDMEGLIMGVDVARYGTDCSVIAFRQGRDARSRPKKKFKGLSITKFAEMCMTEADLHRPDAIVVESTGIGAGVIDIMRDRGYKVVEVHPGAGASKNELYVNKRAEYYSAFRDWVYEGGCLPEDPLLFNQLTKMMYSLGRQDDTRVRIEAKEDMRKRGLESPDDADTLALTFAVKVARRDRNYSAKRQSTRAITEYDEFSY